MKTVIGVDLGSGKTGLALLVQGIALPRKIVPTRFVRDEIRNLLEETQATRIVVGMPDECYPERQAETRSFIRSLQSLFPGVQIESFDEGCTTFEAESDLNEAQKYDPLFMNFDDHAARVLLMRWKNAQKS